LRIGDQALKARFNPKDLWTASELALHVNRAFSAGAFLDDALLGRCPRLTVNVALLALRA
jgi:hypothetical protein